MPVCGQCGTRYAIGVAVCPHCASTELADDTVGRVPAAVTAGCTSDGCRMAGQKRRVLLRRAAVGVVELPTYLCEVCGSRLALWWPGELREDPKMAKVTVHGGPSNAADPNGPDVAPPSRVAEEPVERSADQGDVVTVGEHGPELVVGEGHGHVEPTPDVEPQQSPDESGDDTAEHVAEPDYEARTAVQLRAELADRGLSTAGLKPELIARLREHDANPGTP
ncbi:SAP domain-containing protein [Actinosynnema sp. NPDC023587]|uniref:SAP domain-containing protein n=1 Tax=Actinosynnema sp. NPDC023587 TaxID=3154695 RepID=UPI0033F40C69